jgi:pilus assembly protein CpaB
VAKNRGTWVLVVGVLLAIVASAAVYSFMLQQHTLAERGSGVDTVPVVVAATDLPFSTKLEPIHMKVAQYPRDTVPKGAVSTPDSLVGQTLKVFVVENEPIINSKLSSRGGGLSVRIPEDLRATSVNVNIASGVSGFVLPGDRVDVMVTVDRPGSQEDAITKTILQNVEVLAAGQKTQAQSDKPIQVQSVTLLTGLEGAQKLALAIQEGSLHLALRNPEDLGEFLLSRITTKELLADEARNRAEPVRTTTVKAKPTPIIPPRLVFLAVDRLERVCRLNLDGEVSRQLREGDSFKTWTVIKINEDGVDVRDGKTGKIFSLSRLSMVPQS